MSRPVVVLSCLVMFCDGLVLWWSCLALWFSLWTSCLALWLFCLVIVLLWLVFLKVNAAQRVADTPAGKKGEWVAIKTISKEIILRTKGGLDMIFNERDCLAAIRSPYIANQLHAFQDEANCYLVLDLCLAGDLGFRMRESKDGVFSEDAMRFFCASIAIALQVLLLRCVCVCVCLNTLSYVHSFGVSLFPPHLLVSILLSVWRFTYIFCCIFLSGDNRRATTWRSCTETWNPKT